MPEGPQTKEDTAFKVLCPDFSNRGRREESGHGAAPAGKCGIRRYLVNARTGEERIAWMACKSLGCANCRPKVLASKMTGHEDSILYGTVINNREWQGLQRKLSRQRKAGNEAAYLRVPISPTTVLVVSTYEVGPHITPEAIYTQLDKSESAFGNIATSRDWKQPERPVAAPESEWEDYGIVTAKQDDLVRIAATLDLTLTERDDSLHVTGTLYARTMFRRAAELVDDATFWEMLRERAGLNTQGDGWFPAFLDRLRLDETAA